MASSRPSGFRKSGGFLNGVDVTWTDYEFTTEFPGQKKAAKKKGNDDFNPLYAVISVRLDGADEDEKTTLFAGSADDFEISEDGHTLTPVDDSVGLRGGTGWAIFIGSLCEAGFDEKLLPDEGEPINYEAALGSRLHLIQQVNEEATKKLGKRKGKDGKEYNRQDLVVNKFIAAPGKTAVAPTKAAKGGKPVTGATKPVNGKANGKVQEDLTDLADETLAAILEDHDGEITRVKLAIKVGPKLGSQHPNRNEVKALITSGDYLAGAVERGIIAYDKATQTITTA